MNQINLHSHPHSCLIATILHVEAALRSQD